MDISPEYIKTKICTECDLTKHLYDFTVDNAKPDGRDSRCKCCRSLYNIKHPIAPEKNRENNNRYRKTDKGILQHRKDYKKHRDKYPERVRARLVSLFLEKKPCMFCGGKAEVHHLDYRQPLKVVWLCKKHHEMLDHKQLESTGEELWMLARNM